MKGKNTRDVIIAGISGGVIATIITLLVQSVVYRNPKIYGNVADWVSAFGTIVAAVIALYLGLRPVSRNYKIELYRGDMNFQDNKSDNIRINFAIYNGGNKPFVLYKTYLEGDKQTVELDFDNDDKKFSEFRMPYLLGENDVTVLYLKGNDANWSVKNQPKNPYIVLQEINGYKVKKRLEDFKVK
ncbi:hypothetical protein [Weissella cibaria]|uniref:hypothetical protein n=1 Tax=Weissella cibaria TaxID=137591 RepID=UPI00189B0DA2|nr:hypothetical protein [Weissella cibaria]